MKHEDRTSKYGQIIPIDVESLSFDSFGRNPNLDIVCVSPVRTIVTREEEILLVRRVRKVEEIDAGLACPWQLKSNFSTLKNFSLAQIFLCW